MPTLLKAHWNCHGVCNCHCRFCYGMFKGHPALGTNDAFALIDNLAGQVEEIVFGGGDPFLRKDLPNLIEHACSQKLLVEIQTNAQILSFDLVQRLKQRVVRWGLSLDSWDANLHDAIRGRVGNHKQVVECALLFSKLGLHWNLRTLVSRPTLSTIGPIGDWLEATGFKGVWYLLQYSPVGDEKHHQGEFQISDSEFHAIVNPLPDKYGRAGFRTIPVPDIDRRQIYFLMAPDGAVYNHPPPGQPYAIVGNILTDPFDTLLARLSVDLEKHHVRYGSSILARDVGPDSSDKQTRCQLVRIEPLTAEACDFSATASPELREHEKWK